MAVAWEKQSGDNHYQVRTAGNSKRLYKNGVFHSQWNEQRPIAGGVWDLLFLPALFLEQIHAAVPGKLRVLLLGVGGGAVIRQFNAILPPASITGVELDKIHLQVARNHFGVKGPNVSLQHADAIAWIKSHSGEKFDLIIEDLFTEQKGEAVRVAAADAAWFSCLLAQLRPGGALVLNFEDAGQMRFSGRAYLDVCAGRPDVRYHFSLPSYGNSVCAFLPAEVSPRKLRQRLDELLQPWPLSRGSAQKFRLRRVV